MRAFYVCFIKFCLALNNSKKSKKKQSDSHHFILPCSCLLVIYFIFLINCSMKLRNMQYLIEMSLCQVNIP